MPSVKESWIRKYGLEKGLEMWEERKKLSATTEQSMIKKHGEELGKQKWEEFIKKQQGKGSLKYYIKKHGEKLGSKLYKEKNSKLSINIEALKKNGFSEEAILEIRKKHKQRSIITKNTLIEKYGKEEGEERWKNRVLKAKLSSKRSLDYWLNVNSGNLNKAKEDLKKYQTRDKNFYIKKYGELEGVIKFYEVEKKRFNNIIASRFQLDVEDFVKSLDVKVYGSRNEYSIFLNENESLFLNKTYIIPDILIKDLRIIIECYGDFWHAHENLFEDHEIHPITKRLIADHRKNDNYRIKCFENREYTVIIIWERDWHNSNELIKNIIRNEINQKRIQY